MEQKEIKLLGLTIKNFKGIKEFSFTPDGKNATIFGDNGTGKTTVFDAFLWLLFGKDSNGRADFAIKPLDREGKEVHGLDVEVEITLLVDGQPVDLKKTFKEKWTKKRGSAKATLTGHTTDYAINGIPVKKKEWDTNINSLIDEEVFKLLTNPLYFNSLHWQKRREILLQVCGDVSTKDIITSNPSLSELPEILGNRSVEDHRKLVKSKQQKINKRLQEIPARIDELMRSLPKVQDNPEAIRACIAALEEKLADMKAGDGSQKLREETIRLKRRLEKLEDVERQKKRKAEQEAYTRYSELNRKLMEELQNREGVQQQIRNLESEIANKERRLELYRQDYKRIAAEEFTAESICPTCGQPLPAERIEEAVKNFKERQAKELAEINRLGKALKAEVERDKEDLNALHQNLINLEAEINSLKIKVEDAERHYKEIMETPIAETPEIKEILTQIDEINRQLAQPDQKLDISKLEQQIEAERQKLAQIELAEQTKKRIEELKAEEKKLAQEYEELEREIHLVEQFIVTKVNLLEDKINSRFKLARFKLFDRQINGGINEVCETLYNGVPYNHGLNRGAQINVGLDIIQTLSEHYGVKAPVFIDNAEAVTKLNFIGCQMIKLVVDESKKELEVQYE